MLRNVHVDLLAKIDIMETLTSRLGQLTIEDEHHVLSDFQWVWQDFKVKELAAWVGTLEVS